MVFKKFKYSSFKNYYIFALISLRIEKIRYKKTKKNGGEYDKHEKDTHRRLLVQNTYVLKRSK